MANVYYDGTAAYKIEEYNAYTAKAQKKHEEKMEKQHGKKIAFRKKMIASFGAIFVIAIAFMSLNVALLQASATYESATKELEDIKMRNAQLSFDIASGVDLSVVETKAKTHFGMQKPESYQNVYVNVVQNDYTETFTSKGSGEGFVERMVTNLKAFLTYIG